MAHLLKRLSLPEMDRAAYIHRAARDERLPWLSGLHSPEQDRRFFRSNVFVNTEVWGAGDDEIAGFIAFGEDWIDHLYVLPDRQKEGIGDALLMLAKSARPCLKLWTFQKNAGARAFYENRGFELLEKTDGSGNQEREPDALYRWQR